jgi:catechol 2,3-dioxygenase-like lactoylglutathione lyase family enzyme
MLDHIILTVGDVERSLKFYTAALKPLKIKMFMPYKGAARTDIQISGALVMAKRHFLAETGSARSILDPLGLHRR